MSLVALLYRAPRVKGLTARGEDVNRITQWRTLVGDVVVTITRSTSQLDDLIGTRRKAGIADTEDKVPEIADIDTALEGGLLPVHVVLHPAEVVHEGAWHRPVPRAVRCHLSGRGDWVKLPKALL